MGSNERKEAQTTETQIEEQSPLDELLSMVTLADPLEIEMNNGQMLQITQEQFISYYMPRDATREEKANCFNEVRAAGLNPAIRGDCHFFRTADQPMHLFIGYHVWLRHAWAGDLRHIQKPEIEMGEDGYPLSCTITLEIEGRPDFVWTTWFWEVAATTNDGKLNSRWKKAAIQMFIKCSLVNAFRISGIVDMTLPPAVEEMGIPTAPGHRTLTLPQLDAYEQTEGADTAQEAALGEITAATHQADTSGLRRKYFQLLKELKVLGLSFTDDEERRAWQKEHLGRESVSDVSAEEWPDILMKVTEIKMRLSFGEQESERRMADDANNSQEQSANEWADDEYRKTQAEPGAKKHTQEELEQWTENERQKQEDSTRRKIEAAERAEAEKVLQEEQARAKTEEDALKEAAKAALEAGRVDPDDSGQETVEEDDPPEVDQVLRRKYQDMVNGLFRKPEYLEGWQKLITGEHKMSKWVNAQFTEALAWVPRLRTDRAKYVNGGDDLLDRNRLMALYTQELRGVFETPQELISFQRNATGYVSMQDFGVFALQHALIMLSTLKAQRERLQKADNEDIELDITDEGTPVKPGETEPPDEPGAITPDDYKKLKAICVQLPAYTGMGSQAFRHRVFEIIGYSPKRMALMTEAEGKQVIAALEQEQTKLLTLMNGITPDE